MSHSQEVEMTTQVGTNIMTLCRSQPELTYSGGGVRMGYVATQIGMTLRTLERIIAFDTQEPTDSTLAPIARYFGVTLDELKGDLKTVDSG